MRPRAAARARYHCAHLTITDCKIVENNEFDRTARFTKPMVRVAIFGALVPKDQGDGAFLWRVGHEIVPAALVTGAERVALDILRSPLDEATARAAAAERAAADAARELAAAQRERDELRARNENLRQLLMLRNQLPARSTAFPKESNRFGWLEVD